MRVHHNEVKDEMQFNNIIPNFTEIDVQLNSRPNLKLC